MNSKSSSNQIIERNIGSFKSRVERTFTVVTLVAGLDLGMFIFLHGLNKFYSVLFGSLVISVILYLLYSNLVISKITASLSRFLLGYPFDIGKKSDIKIEEYAKKIQSSSTFHFSELNRFNSWAYDYTRKTNYLFNLILFVNLILFIFIILFF